MRDDSITVKLVDGTVVPEWLRRETIEQVTLSAEKLESNAIRVLEYLVDWNYWNSLTPLKKRLAGKCMVDFVAYDPSSPYEFWRKRSDRTQEYILSK